MCRKNDNADFAARLDWMLRCSNARREFVHCHLLLNLSDLHKNSRGTFRLRPAYDALCRVGDSTARNSMP